MKILFIGAYDDAEVVLAPLKVANKLFCEFDRMQNVEIKYFTYFDDGEKYSYKQKFFGSKKIKKDIYRLGIFQLLKKVLNYKPDVIQILNPEAFYLPLFLLKPIIKSKIIYHSHSLLSLMIKHYLYDISKYERIRFKIICVFVYRFSHYILLFSEKERRYLRRYLKIDEKKIIIVHNGADDLPIKKKYNLYKWKNKIAFIGSLQRKEKGFSFLLKSLYDLNSNIKLFIFNYSPQEAKFTSSQVEVKYEDPLPENKLREFLCQMDCVIIPSSYDPFPLIFMEAINSGILCLFSNKIGQIEIATDKMLEYSFSLGKTEDLKKKYSWLANLSSYDKDFDSKSFIEFSQNFTWDKIAQKYLNEYKSMLDL